MCKLAIIPKVTVETQENAWKFAFAIRPHLTAADNDAFGYMALKRDGSNVFGERWTKVDTAFKHRSSQSRIAKRLARAYQGTLLSEETYNNFGGLTPDISCLALHARMATCGKSLVNAHPHVSKDETVAMIHNGIVSTTNLKMHNSTCDSEGLMNEYHAQGVHNKIRAIDILGLKVSGYYACAVLAKQDSGRWILDVFRDDKANLSAVFVPKIKGLVFATNPDHVYKACKELRWRGCEKFDVAECVLMRHDALTGEVLQTIEFDTRMKEEYDWTDRRNWSDQRGYLDNPTPSPVPALVSSGVGL